MDYAAPALFALFTWWFATGIILWLDGLPARTHRWTLMGSTLILIGSGVALYQLRGATDVTAIYLSFLAVLGIWAWNETTFLLGVLTGPVQRPCPEGAVGMERFRAALDSVLYHEAGLILSGVAIAIITWGDTQHFALHLFALLWALRLSTKLNLFFGVPHAPGHFLPEQLRYLATYFREPCQRALCAHRHPCHHRCGSSVRSGWANRGWQRGACSRLLPRRFRCARCDRALVSRLPHRG